MKIKLTKNQWIAIGKKAGFVDDSDIFKPKVTTATAKTAETAEVTKLAKTVKTVKTSAQIPNTQNQNPDESNFAVDLSGKRKSLGKIKNKINNEIHALGNYFQRVPLQELINIFKKYNVVMLQEDGTKWAGFVSTQGECGSEEARKGMMKFDLAMKLEMGSLDEEGGYVNEVKYVMCNNILAMSVCTMSSGRLEMVAYVS